MLAAAWATRANEIYTYTGLPTYQGANGYPAVGATITLDLTDAAVQSGSFSLSGYGTLGAPDYTGNFVSLVSLTTPAPFTATPSGISGGGIFSVSFTFDAVGDITSDAVQYSGLDGDGLAWFKIHPIADASASSRRGTPSRRPAHVVAEVNPLGLRSAHA